MCELPIILDGLGSIEEIRGRLREYPICDDDGTKVECVEMCYNGKWIMKYYLDYPLIYNG